MRVFSPSQAGTNFVGEFVVLVHSKDTNGAFAILDQTIPKDEVSSRHRHTREGHLVEVLSGKLQLSLNDEVSLANQGDLFWIGPGVWHEFVARDTPTRLRVTLIPGGLEKFFQEYRGDMTSAEYYALASKYGVDIEAEQELKSDE